MTVNQTSYQAHLAQLDGVLAEALERSGHDALLLHSGRASFFPADDQTVPFRATPHLCRWVPLSTPDQLVLVRPGCAPRVVRYTPRDYWSDVSIPADSYWQAAVDLVEIDRLTRAPDALGSLARTAFIGDPHAADELGIAAEDRDPPLLCSTLEWHRATKSPHEQALMRCAAERAALAHLGARAAFEAGADERSVYRAYIEAGDLTPCESPYHEIIAFDAKAAILHYQRRRGRESSPAWVCLVDAGAAHDGYVCDLTRTWIRPGAHPVFSALRDGLDILQRELVGMIRPGRPYVEIHERAQRGVGELLVRHGVLTCSAEAAYQAGLTRTFMPHGVGHQLGLQVHDVGGHQAGPDGGVAAPPASDPFLRNTRTCEAGQVLTIEPGVYFVPMLLEPLRVSVEGQLVDWDLVARLLPLGGIRIEDNVVCTAEGARDFSRDLLPQ